MGDPYAFNFYYKGGEFWLVKNIEPWEDSGKYVVNFAEPAKEIDPVPLVPKSRVKALQNARYTSFDRLQKAKNLDEVF